ncbi:ferredoxin [Amycolatopsis sp. H20-H5]|uniref:ferredoxin n=1 Tax=Amycolatopsis sp. H20-H5 TaxID=3046309 RepID=UPI002DB71122|nr:ferredoxin [Amycolatopsis sp. H20-H5]MEC3979848.1 ferredoxin [Amycolatopsis sp. H20-H5]
MSQPPAPMNAAQQHQFVWRIGQALAAATPPGWRQLRVEYRAAGRHIEADLLITGSDGLPRTAQPPAAVVALLGTLRSAMYQPGRGTWLGAILVFGPANVLSADFLPDLEPPWRRVPPPIGFADELRFFPRAEQHIPDWLRARAQLSLSPSPGMRTPRIYDGLDASGRPVVNREPLTPAERERVLAYLDAAPVVLAARSYDTDAFDPDRPAAVPLNFRTDGSWTWPGAVAYYLREHELAPDPELLTHIRAARFTLPEVGEPARDLALAAITGDAR